MTNAQTDAERTAVLVPPAQNGRAPEQSAAAEARSAKPKRKKKEKGKKKDRGKGRKGKQEPRFTAATADKYELYQLAVQSPEEDLEFLERVYKKKNGRRPVHLREDFCGTALLCATWVGLRSANTAEGFDIDPEPVQWGAERHFATLGEAAERAKVHLADAREPSDTPADFRCAHNFSYCVFHERAELKDYLQRVFDDLAPGGMLSLDMHGGPESMYEMEEVREVEDGLDYVWHQDRYWPASADYRTSISFRFEDGTVLERCFKYRWRLWTLSELKDLMQEVGFTSVDSYWEGTDSDGESGNGVFKKSKKGENCLSWISYLIGFKESSAP